MNAEWQPLISVVIPIYNAGPYLGKCIRSVIGQTYRNLEIILVDDGSTDDCPKFCDAYAAMDQRITVIHKRNEGLVRARKTGVARATGEYITFVDADDWIDPETYETILGKMAARSMDMVLYGLVEEYEDRAVKKENLLAEGYYADREKIREKIYPEMLCCGHFFQSGVLPNLVCKMIRRELVKRVQPLVSDEVELGEDADAAFQMLLQCESIQIMRFTPYHYRKRQDSMVWRPTELPRIRALYRDLENAFRQSTEREILMPQLYHYLLFVMMLKAADSFIGCESFASCFAGKRIVLYGAGGFGQAIYRMVTERGMGQICLWVDQRYQVYQRSGLQVSGPEKMEECVYDHVFIAVLDTRICGEIAENLMGRGICGEKISYIKPDETYTESLLSVLERPLISIVMPVYNGEKYLREAVDSIIGQTFADWELILVDDCSTDTTPVIAEEYQAADGRIRVINNRANQKLPRSLNIGFDHARGKYFTWTSDDNRYRPEALQEMLRYLEDNREIGMVYADMDYTDEKGERTGSVSRGAEEIYGSNCVGACFLYRKEAAEAIGEYDAGLFLVEDYDYWLRIAKRYPIAHLPCCLYEYRLHRGSLTQTRAEKIEQQLYRLRCRELDFLLSRAEGQQREVLFMEMWRQSGGQISGLREKFFGERGLPETLKWIERDRRMDENRKIILFGAGAFGKKALDYFGADRVACYADNNAALTGSTVNGKKVISFEALREMGEDYQIVISVDVRKIPVLAAQLEENGITDYEVYLEMVRHFKKPSGEKTVSWLENCEKAREWIVKYTEPEKGIAHSSTLQAAYPEVTGYYIPTLMRWGFPDMAVSYAKWLCSIQHPDGAWYDVEGRDPYVFDTAQILKGLLAVRDRVDGADAAIRKGCDWILSNMEESGRLNTPSREAWGEEGICSELIHLYCLSPLYEAAEIFGEERYRRAAERTVDYYVNHTDHAINDFSFLSHFYAYVMEGLCDVGQKELAREAMKQMERLLDEKGYVPAYRDVNWVCSTGMFQLAVVWFKLGDLEHGNKALTYAAGLQNESGGWYGSYPAMDAPGAADRTEYPDYMADSEISWAVKYFLDAVYWKQKLEFENQASVFLDTIAEEDGRYQVILNEARSREAKRILDVGCGKGRYLKNLKKAMPGAEYRGVDLSAKVMESIPSSIETREGILTQIPCENESFDLVYAAEALEHSIFPDNALREMLRVTAPGGEVVIIDKNKAMLGALEIDEWEQWFEDGLFERITEEENCSLKILKNVPYEDGISDGLFHAWILRK